MNARVAKWAVALLLSAVLHAGAAIWFSADHDEVELAGGATAEIAVLGNAFQDAVAAGQATDVVEPVETETETVEPVEGRPLESVQPVEVQPEIAIQQQAVAPAEQTDTAKPVTQDAAEPVEPVENGIAIAAIQPEEVVPENREAVPPAQTVAVQPTDEIELPQTPEIAPRPTPRPEQMAKAEPPKKAEPEPREKAEKKPVEKPREKKQRAGAGGQNNANVRKGTADGSKDARQAQSGGSGKSRESGNAAVSNYPGKIVSKLRRSLRYPSEAKRRRIRGEVHVRFTVSRSGGVGSVGVARSSGSPVLDNAAVETVRRAAPFPAIPAEAGRSSWSFTVPLAFSR